MKAYGVYYAAHREEIKARSKVYGDAHKKEKAAWAKAYRIANPDKTKARDKAYRTANREKRNSYHKIWHAENRESQGVYHRAYLKTPRGKIGKSKADAHRHRSYGYNILNIYFPGSVGHHINDFDVVFIPENIHQSCLSGPDKESHRKKIMVIYGTLENMIAGSST